ncbi:Choline dehydrogenase, mitochondrial, partial [Exaiptasia diaphana]
KKLTEALARTAATFSSTHDYVICGAGSAGCVLTNRLTADPNNDVLLLEAGPRDWTWKIHMPAALVYNLCDDKYNWYYHTVPQKHMDNRVMYCPRGRVWGGSSSLNAMVYIRGHALDYDRWESEGAKGWSYADCLPYFKKAQTHELGKDAQTDEEIDAFIRQYADTAYHPSCTCKMGDSDDNMAVVDNQGRVFGVENLRVIDSSIMPSIVSGNLNAPTIMIAEKMADCILGNQPLPRSNAPVYQTPEKGQR